MFRTPNPTGIILATKAKIPANKIIDPEKAGTAVDPPLLLKAVPATGALIRMPGLKRKRHIQSVVLA
jgi:hypothetical protein